jgi:hypothetical protein
VNDENKNLDLFRTRKYRQEHHELIRSDEWEAKRLPDKIKKQTTLLPANLAHSNLFMFNTRNKEWLLDKFPIQSRWIPKEYSIFYTGSGLDSYDLEIMINVIKMMESREQLNEKYVQDYADKVLESDEEYQVMPEAQKTMYRQQKIRDLNLAEGIFLEMEEFLKMAGLSKGGKTAELVKNSLSKMSRGSLTISTNFEDDREDFEITERLINYVYLPKKDAFYITLTPMMLDMFMMQTSTLNTYVMRNISQGDKSRQKIDINMYSTLMTYARDKIWEVDITHFLNKSPYYLMKQRHIGEITEGKIVYALPDGKIDEKGISEKKLNDYISNNRRDIVAFFTRLESLSVLKFQLEGRGDNTKIRFLIPKDVERIATDSIRLREEAKQLNLDLPNDSGKSNK